MDRLEQLRQVIDDIVRNNPDIVESRCGFVHLYGVSATCTILALRRGLDPQLCSAAGMLHDIWNYKIGDTPDHGQLGADEARVILTELASFSPEEIDLICHAISRHTDKQSVNSDLDELLKDADVFQHYLYNPSLFKATASADSVSHPMRIKRLHRVMADLGLECTR
jgi:uncharacterized protein